MENQDVQKRFGHILVPIRAAIFGRQNERLEYLMDSYFKLTPEWRSAVLVGGVFISVLSFFGILALYLAALGGLQTRLDQAFQATNELKDFRHTYSITKQKFGDLEQRLETANEGLVLISVLETKAKELGLTTSGFPPQLPTSELPAGNPLSAKYQSAKVEFRVSNVSLKKIVEFVVAIENLPHMLRVSSLKIKGLYQNKLFFDATFEVEGIVKKGS